MPRWPRLLAGCELTPRRTGPRNDPRHVAKTNSETEPPSEPSDGISLTRPSRPERVAQIERLEQRGLTTREIAEQLGLAPSTINIYRRDPDGSLHRRRLERYRGRCRGCGAPTSGSGGPGRAPEWCRRCAGERRRSWTEQRILAAIKEWAAETGAPPRVRDWSPAHAPERHARAQRFTSEPGRWPSASVVSARFGSFRAAIEHAGLRVTGGAGARRWTPERIVAAVLRFENETGRPPRRVDWHHATEWHPTASTVYRVMGSWRGALRAARTSIRTGRR
jgi:transcriptional regulator with XRE-family HTH domain